MHEYVLDGVIGAQSYFQVGAFKQIGDEGSLFAYVSETHSETTQYQVIIIRNMNKVYPQCTATRRLQGH